MLTFLAVIAVSLFWTVAALWSDHRHRLAMREAEERAVLWEVRATRLNHERAQAVHNVTGTLTFDIKQIEAELMRRKRLRGERP